MSHAARRRSSRLGAPATPTRLAHTHTKRERASPPAQPADETHVEIDTGAGPSDSPVKKIKMELTEDEKRKVKVPKHWREAYALMVQQRDEIVTPVDTMGCEENGREDRRADRGRRGVDGQHESEEDAAKRLRFTTLISLMLSSQTKDPVTADAVYRLQTRLDNGLCLASLLAPPDDVIQECIAKVGFFRRKTEYVRRVAEILRDRFDGDVPRTVDELCSLPGVGPKMAFLQMQSMGLNVGIGVDTHVHRISNRLGWCRTKTPEQTRLALQSWLPTEVRACAHAAPRRHQQTDGRLRPGDLRPGRAPLRVRLHAHPVCATWARRGAVRRTKRWTKNRAQNACRSTTRTAP